MAMTNHFSKERKKALADAEKLKNQQEKDLRNDYDTQIFETKRGYEDEYRENAVQKAINERQVAESMANMGLRDSGLNRTQQTAVQLSYANNNAAIDKAKRQATDSLNLQKTRDLASLNQNWLAKKESINQTYDNMEADYAAKVSAARYQYLKSQNQNQGVILTDGANLLNISGRLEDNGVQRRFTKDGKVIYTDIRTGKSTTMETTTNPFTGDNNASKITSTGRAGQTYGYYNNGYQPRGVEGYGKFTTIKDKTPYNGRNQNVFVTNTKGKGEHYWLWKDDENKYIEVFVNEKGYWAEKVE